MDNRFKVRAWIISQKKVMNVEAISYKHRTLFTGDYWYTLDCVKLLQCTGLLANLSYRGDSEDDNAIYEGDILRYTYEVGDSDFVIQTGECICSVVYLDGSFCTNENEAYGCIIDDSAFIEIIGNIYEHKELL